MFNPITIGVGHKRVALIDAVLGSANPAKELLREAQHVFGEDAKIVRIFSLGSGKNARVVFEDGRQEGIINNARLRRMLEQVHEDLWIRLRDTAIYHRFNVEQELGIQPEIVSSVVSAYLEEPATSDRVDDAVATFYRLPPGVKIRDISKHEFMLRLGTQCL
jgi:hypothetical protein